ncbi:CFI-box-CTERM domain-containing protein [Bdellovibrio reynosensis]|uniref:Serine protease n=1 Tax=Bdellovibrio reynosensis TaxID=2835041 RepID=A0ABY4C537_9BACT|nr:CFI-box-CTERM domain-containing protein [Bdellovibrio reynosensis]UOE99972.1 hypothetical protein MNR06_09700 [Bdellovibrio reynosensis]
MSVPAYGATLVSIAGASATDLTTATKPIIYAGMTAGCTGDGETTCDSCTGVEQTTPITSKLWTCNKENVYPNLKLTITMTSTAAATSSPYIKINDTTFTPSIAQTYVDGTLITQITWAELCNAAGKNSDCTGGSFSIEMDVGLESTAGTTTTDSLPFKVTARVAATDGSDWLYTDCNTADSTSNSGFCHFKVFPGDGKIYADELAVDQGYPSTPASGVTYSNVVFFYEEQADGEADTDTIASISNASPSFVVGVNTAGAKVQDNRIDGLINEKRYCMVMANKDVTGIISFFTPIPGTSGSPVTANELCTEPAPVIGLLDDKNCFIATAAFGSDMAPEVQSFRDFRNQYLLTSKWGTAFVKFYYKHSPFYANLIAESEIAKTIVRAALWPLLFFARMSVALGFFTSLIISLIVGLSLFEMYRRLVFRRSYRGEL